MAVMPFQTQPELCQISDPSHKLTKTSPLAIALQVFHSKLTAFLLLHKSYPECSYFLYLPCRFNSKHNTP